MPLLAALAAAGWLVALALASLLFRIVLAQPVCRICQEAPGLLVDSSGRMCRSCRDAIEASLLA